MGSKKYYDNPAVVANYTRSIAQMFQVLWTGQPIPNASLFQDPENKEYMETAKLIAEFESKLIHASPDPELAQETAVSFIHAPTLCSHMLKHTHNSYFNSCPMNKISD